MLVIEILPRTELLDEIIETAMFEYEYSEASLSGTYHHLPTCYWIKRIVLVEYPNGFHLAQVDGYRRDGGLVVVPGGTSRGESGGEGRREGGGERGGVYLGDERVGTPVHDQCLSEV